MADREAAIAHFLARSGWAGATRRPLAGDASFRRYERLFGDGQRAVLMDAPPPNEDVRPFVKVARFLTMHGYSAPAIIAADEIAGLLLLEDLGDALFTKVLHDGAMTTPLYQAAIDLLVDLHEIVPPDGLPRYDAELMVEEAELFIDWYLAALAGKPAAEAARVDFRRRWRQVLDSLPAETDVLVLRDYHADNLMWLPDRAGKARVGLLDFQDAVVGHRAYDVVSVLEDARRDVAPALAEAMIARYLDRTGLDEAAFHLAYAALGAQRNTRIVGVFTRLWQRDGKPQYLDYLPRVWKLLAGDLARPELASLRAWYDRHVPPARRDQPLPGAPN